MDLDYYDAIPQIANCPVSLVFRLRAVRHLGTIAINKGSQTFADIESYLDQVILDHPNTLKLVHEYDQSPSLEFLVNELYHTDFGRCYLASKTLLEHYPQEAPAALIQSVPCCQSFSISSGMFSTRYSFGIPILRPFRAFLFVSLIHLPAGSFRVVSVPRAGLARFFDWLFRDGRFLRIGEAIVDSEDDPDGFPSYSQLGGPENSYCNDGPDHGLVGIPAAGGSGDDGAALDEEDQRADPEGDLDEGAGGGCSEGEQVADGVHAGLERRHCRFVDWGSGVLWGGGFFVWCGHDLLPCRLGFAVWSL